MLEIRCKSCGKELVSHPTQLKSCGCPNLTSIRGTNISGNNLDQIEILRDGKEPRNNVLSNEDLQYQEQRKKRKIRKLEFEER